MLGVFAEFETNLRRERQLEGIQAAKARGVYKGCRPVIDPGSKRPTQRVRYLTHRRPTGWQEVHPMLAR
jgi:DNA invertase Pin-like site-specific DNA recombinase